MKTNTKHTMPRLRHPRFDAAMPAANRRTRAARLPRVMTPHELRAEVLALIG